MEHTHKKHVHHGRSTKGILDARGVLDAIGIRRGEVFLDAGCGDGFISIVASGYVGNEGRVYALDVYEKSIEELREEIRKKGIQNIEPIVADVTDKIPLPENSIDICLLANVLHGFVENNELDRAMREIVRVLKLGGRLAIVEFKKPGRIFKVGEVWKNIKLYFVGPPLNVRLSPEETGQYLKKYGITFQKISDVGEYHYAWIGVLSQK